MTPLQIKIISILAGAPRRRMGYHEMLFKLWPPHENPRAWRYRTGGGPPACAMPFGRALNKLVAARMVHYGSDPREVILIKNAPSQSEHQKADYQW